MKKIIEQLLTIIINFYNVIKSIMLFIISFFELVGIATINIFSIFIFIFELVGKSSKYIFNNLVRSLAFIGSNKLITGAVFFLLMATGPSLIALDIYYANDVKIENEKSLELFFNSVAEVDVEEDETLDEQVDISNNEDKTYEELYSDFKYVVEIPKIDLLQGVVDGDRLAKSIHRNVSAIYQTDTPDIENGNFVLAAHRGTRPTGYFNDINKLSKGNNIHIYYNNKLYIYEVTHNFTIDETNFEILDRQKDKTIITLFTCKKGDDTKRVVIQGILKIITDY